MPEHKILCDLALMIFYPWVLVYQFSEMNLQSCQKINLSWLADWFAFWASIPFFMILNFSFLVQYICQNSLGCKGKKYKWNWLKQKGELIDLHASLI